MGSPTDAARHRAEGAGSRAPGPADGPGSGGVGEPPDGPEQDRGKPVGRRVVLSVLALGATGVVAGNGIQNFLSSAVAPIAEHDPTGLTNLLPLGQTFRFYSVTDSVPMADPATYRLGVTGLVDKEQHYSLTDLADLPQTSFVRDFQCVTGWRVPNVPWTGVRLSAILTAVGVKPQAKALRFVSFDGTYTESLTLDQAQNPDMIVALRMLNGPVSHNHGGPVRLYAAPMYGYKSIKWLSEIQLVDRVEPGYWEGFGYDIDAWVGKSNGRDDAPTGWVSIPRAAPAERAPRPPGSALIERFSRAERYVHWTTALLMLTLIATGAILYLPELSVAAGHRQDIALIHLYCGFGLPIPMAAGIFSKAYRADARRLNRHTADDRAWLRGKGWKHGRAAELGVGVGKFNAGQKLNAAFLCGAILVMVGTGTLMWFPHLVSVPMRTGATFVHDWLALAIGFVIAGHLWFAFGDPEARDGMRNGQVPRWWAEEEHGLWAAESAAPEHADDDARPNTGIRPPQRP